MKELDPELAEAQGLAAEDLLEMLDAGEEADVGRRPPSGIRVTRGSVRITGSSSGVLTRPAEVRVTR